MKKTVEAGVWSSSGGYIEGVAMRVNDKDLHLWRILFLLISVTCFSEQW